MLTKENLNEERQYGPTTYTLSFIGIMAVAGLLAIGVASYNSVMNEIARLERAKVFQEGVIDNLMEEIKLIRRDQSADFVEYNGKLDQLIELKEKACGS